MAPRFAVDRLQESTLRVLGDDGERTMGAAFLVREDGYLLTCHHVIYRLPQLQVEHAGEARTATWVEHLSRPDADIAVLKVEGLTGVSPLPIVEPDDEPTDVIAFGYPERQAQHFPAGFDVSAADLRPSAPVRTLSTYAAEPAPNGQPWNRLPEETATFRSLSLAARMDHGMSGGPVIAPTLGGVVGVIQSSGERSFLIRWDNLRDPLQELGLEPRTNIVLAYLDRVADEARRTRLFHSNRPILLDDQYVPIQVTTERLYRHEIESLVAHAEPDERAYAARRRDGEATRVSQAFEEARQAHRHLVVLADPGMGKSTALRMEAGLHARRTRQELARASVTIDDIVLPIRLALAELDETPGEVAPALRNLALGDRALETPWVAELFDKKLDRGHCLLLLDSLDEVPPARRIDLLERLNRFVRAHDCEVVLTSRIVGYAGHALDAGKDVEIIPFTFRQTAEFVHRWFANAADRLSDGSASPKALVRLLRDRPEIGAIARNPLLLSLTCSLYQQRPELFPVRRGRLYDQAVTCMLETWGLERPAGARGRTAAKQRLLEFIAFSVSSEGAETFSSDRLHALVDSFLRSDDAPSDFRDSAAGALIDELTKEDGILQLADRLEQRYLFLHRTFQEHFAACYLRRQFETDPQEALQAAIPHLWAPEWHETLVMLAGLLERPAPLIKALLDARDDVFHSGLGLANRAIAEARLADSPDFQPACRKLFEIWRQRSRVTFLRAPLAAVAQTSETVIEWIIEGLNSVDEELAQATLALVSEAPSEASVSALCALVDSDLTGPHAAQAIESLRRVGSTVAVPTLRRALQANEGAVRNTTIRALGEIGGRESGQVLIEGLTDGDDFDQGTVVESLARIHDPDITDALLAVLEEDEPARRAQAVSALGGHRGEDVVSALFTSMRDPDSNVRAAAAWALSLIGPSGAAAALLRALADPDEDVRRVVDKALKQLGKSHGVESLAEAIEDDEVTIKVNAIVALRRLGTPAAGKHLLQALRHTNPSVRAFAAHHLARIEDRDPGALPATILPDEDAVPALIRMTKDESLEVAMNAGAALASRGRTEFYEPFLIGLESEDPLTRAYAAKLAANADPSKVLRALIDASSDSEASVRTEAARSLGQLKATEAVPQLLNQLGRERDPRMASVLCEALGRIADPAAVPGLLACLQSSELQGARAEASFALASIGSTEGIRALEACLDDSPKRVRMITVLGLKEVGSDDSKSLLLKALTDSSSSVRGLAASALGQHREDAVVSALVETYRSDEDTNVRFHAAQSLAVLATRAAWHVLIERLADENYGDVGAAVQRLEPSDQAAFVIAALRHGNPTIQSNAAIMASSMVAEQSELLDSLLEVLRRGDDESRSSAAYAISRTEAQLDEEVLIELLEDPNDSVRSYALRLLSHQPAELAIPALHRALADPSRFDRSWVIRELAPLATLETLSLIVEHPAIGLEDDEVYMLAQRLSVRFALEPTELLPLYPECVKPEDRAKPE